MTLSRTDLARLVADDLGLPAAVVEKVIRSFAGHIVEAVSSGDRVEIRNFGVFLKKELGPRTLRNPQTGKKMLFPASSGVKFKPGKIFKNL